MAETRKEFDKKVSEYDAWLRKHIGKTVIISNTDGRPLGENGMSLERKCAVEIMEYLSERKFGKKWYESEDNVTLAIIRVVDEYLKYAKGVVENE